MGEISKSQLIDMVKKGVTAVMYVLGIALMAYNLIAFKSDKFGLYYIDDNQMWFALGAGLVAAGWVVRNWQKI